MSWGSSLSKTCLQFYACCLHKSKAKCHYENSTEVFTIPFSFENITVLTNHKQDVREVAWNYIEFFTVLLSLENINTVVNLI